MDTTTSSCRGFEEGEGWQTVVCRRAADTQRRLQELQQELEQTLVDLSRMRQTSLISVKLEASNVSAAMTHSKCARRCLWRAHFGVSSDIQTKVIDSLVTVFGNESPKHLLARDLNSHFDVDSETAHMRTAALSHGESDGVDSERTTVCPKESVELILDRFSDDSGWVQVSELSHIWSLSTIGAQKTEESVQALVGDLDADGSGRVQALAISQWLLVACSKPADGCRLNALRASVSDCQLKAAFAKVNSDGSGKVTFAGFCYALEDLNIRWGIGEAKSIFKQMTATKCICFADFKLAFFALSTELLLPFWLRLLGLQSTAAVAFGTEDLRWEVSEESSALLPLSEIRVLIASKKSDWKRRLVALRHLSGHLCAAELSDGEFAATLWPLCASLKMQLNERRSAVSAACSLQLTEVVRFRGAAFRPFVGFFVAATRTVLRMTVAVMSDAANALLTQMLLSVGEHLPSQCLLKEVIQALYHSKFEKVRKCALAYLCLLLTDSGHLFAQALADDCYLDAVSQLLTAAVKDASAKVRAEAFEALTLLQAIDDTRANAILDQMSKAAKQHFVKVKKKKKAASGKPKKKKKSKSKSKSKKGKAKKRTTVAQMRRQFKAQKRKAAAANAANLTM